MDPMMDIELEAVLAEALGGCDPLELLLQDEQLTQVAEEVFPDMLNTFQPEDNDRFQDVTDDYDILKDILGEDDKGDDSPPVTEEVQNTFVPSPQSNSSDSNNSADSSYNKKTSSNSPKSGIVGADLAFDLSKKRQVPERGAPCVACGRPTKGHYYYQVIVCHSCRAFFGRAIKGEAYKDFICVSVVDGTSCPLNSKSWKSCQRCRFQRCRDVGMKFPDEEAVATPKNSQLAILMEHGGRLDFTAEYVRKTKAMLSPIATLTTEEKFAMEQIMMKHHCSTNYSITRLFRSNLKLLRNTLEIFYHGKPYPLDMYKVLEDYMAYGALQDYLDGSAWSNSDGLSQKDHAKLVASNFPLVTELQEVARVDTVQAEDLEALMKKLTLGLDSSEKETINDIFSEVSDNGKLKVIPPTYDRFFNVDELTASEREVRAYKDSIRRIRTMLKGWSDPVLFILATCIIMYTPDFLELDDAKGVEKMQTTFACLLHRYLREQNHPRKEALFREAMMASSYARDLRDFKVKAFRRLKL